MPFKQIDPNMILNSAEKVRHMILNVNNKEKNPSLSRHFEFVTIESIA